jgi:uncharacterized phage-associated protein
MTAAARDVAAELRSRLPGLPVKKLHKLLYYCQGHHLAAFGSPLFAETVSAWDMGPVIGQLWHEEKAGSIGGSGGSLTEAQLNTIGYVLSRYGSLTGHDLENLTHSEEPWKRADQSRAPGGTARIERDWMTDYFRTVPAEDDVLLDPEAVSQWLAGARSRLADPVNVDDPREIRARLQRRA